MRKLRGLTVGEKAATASEYAAIFAVVVIALMVCVNILGRHVGRAVQSANAKINGEGACVLGSGPAAGPARGPSKKSDAKSTEQDGDEAAAYVPPIPDRTESTPDTRTSRSNPSPDSAAAGEVGKLFGAHQSRKNPMKN